MGNVAFDLLKFLDNKNVAILSGRDWNESPFDNHLLREIIDEMKWSISSNALPCSVDQLMRRERDGLWRN